jgi:hypothetical protein
MQPVKQSVVHRDKTTLERWTLVITGGIAH